MAPVPESHNLVSDTPESTQTSVSGTQAADPSTGHELGRVGDTGSWEFEIITFPQLIPYGEEFLRQEK